VKFGSCPSVLRLLFTELQRGRISVTEKENPTRQCVSLCQQRDWFHIKIMACRTVESCCCCLSPPSPTGLFCSSNSEGRTSEFLSGVQHSRRLEQHKPTEQGQMLRTQQISYWACKMSTSCFPIKDKTCDIEAYNLQQYSIRKEEQNPLNFCTHLGTTFGPTVEKH